MAKAAPDAFFDAALNTVKTAGTKQHACSAQPTTYAEANATYMLAQKTGMTTADFTLADDTSGRKCTIAAQSGVVIANSGTATHIAITDGANLLYVTTCTSQALTANGSNTVNFPPWKISIADPT